MDSDKWQGAINFASKLPLDMGGVGCSSIMCTMAWGINGSELWICFNRDEQRTRPEAELPKVWNVGKHPVVYARDPLGGGTWLAVSRAGYIVAVMNQYQGDGPDDKIYPQSRGSIVVDLIHTDSAESAARQISGMEGLKHYAPFYLYILGKIGGRQWSWNGDRLFENPDCPRFWTTSSYLPRDVIRWRKKQWRTCAKMEEIDLNQAARILRKRDGEYGFGMTMDREDARTVSQTCIVVGQKGVSFAYSHRESNGFSFAEPVKLAMLE